MNLVPISFVCIFVNLVNNRDDCVNVGHSFLLMFVINKNGRSYRQFEYSFQIVKIRCKSSVWVNETYRIIKCNLLCINNYK